MNPENLRIIIVSTPRTGNNWLKRLLSAIYDLPIVDLPIAFDSARINEMGQRWVAHQHYFYHPDIIAWAKGQCAVLITMVRHPGDTLVSFFHYIVNNTYTQSTVSEAAAALSFDGNNIGVHGGYFVRTEFFDLLRISTTWMLSGESLVVRYEDLWRDPQHTLEVLTSQISPVPQESIERSIDRCEISNLRSLYDREGRFYRKGSVGDWQHDLPEEIVEIFSQVDPYPSLFASLGYTLHPNDHLPGISQKSRSSRNPFHQGNSFDNGVTICPIIVQMYLSIEDCYGRWPNALTVKQADSFFMWINAPAERDPYKNASPRITNLAHYLYHIRPDIQQEIQEPFGRDRLALAYWFTTFAMPFYDLDYAFAIPILESSSWMTFLERDLTDLSDRTSYIANLEREWRATQDYIRRLERTHPLLWLRRLISGLKRRT